MIGAFKFRWTITSSSWSQGWKKRCLTLLNRISIVSFQIKFSCIQSIAHIPTFCEPSDWYLMPFWWISTSPGNLLPSRAGRMKASVIFAGLLPLSSTRDPCSMTSAISFFCCSRLFASFFRSVICLQMLSKRWPSGDRYETERMNVASGSSNG